MPRLLNELVKKQIIGLRETGHSIPEIHKITGKSKSTVQRLIKDVEVLPAYRKTLRIKQGGSHMRASLLRESIDKRMHDLIGGLVERDLLFLLIGLYWGEGTKGDFCIVNSDPKLIVTFIECLKSIGIARDRLTMTIRIHSDLSYEKAKVFWVNVTGIAADRITSVEVISRKEKGKLLYGMCRIRVKQGIHERLVIQRAIEFIGNSYQTL